MGWNLPCLPPSQQVLFRQALEEEDVELVWRLCRNPGSDLDFNDRVDGRCAIHLAVLYQHMGLVECLIRSRINVNAVDDNGQTGLFICCLSGRLDMVTILFEAKADIHQADHAGTTPFMASCWRGHVNVAKFLYENGASLIDRNLHQETAMSLSKTWSQLGSMRFLVTALVKDVLLMAEHESDTLRSKIQTCFERVIQDTNINALYIFGAEILMPLRESLSNGSGQSQQFTPYEIISKLDNF